ncbi:MAG: heme exporter protein CcmD [Gammaproteobacteria bacterium]
MSSWSEFIHMGGYAFYVWTSYGLALVVLVANVIAPLLARKQVVRMLHRRIRREETK